MREERESVKVISWENLRLLGCGGDEGVGCRAVFRVVVVVGSTQTLPFLRWI